MQPLKHAHCSITLRIGHARHDRARDERGPLVPMECKPWSKEGAEGSLLSCVES